MSHILQKVAPLGEQRDAQLLEDANSVVYRTIDGIELKAHIFAPKLSENASPAPAVLFFHGGLWESPMATQFVPHCLHFADRGALGITFEYRTKSKHASGPMEALEDAIAAIKWVHEQAKTLSIDPENIVFSGASGGAWLALNLALKKSKELTLPIQPKALVCFSALVNTTPKGQAFERFSNKNLAIRNSPTKQLRRKVAPMLFIHGASDRITPLSEVEIFRRKAWWRGVRCTILDYHNADHSFFNFNLNHDTFETTINAADAFLTDCGILPK